MGVRSSLQELPFWSQVDLQTLRSELKARLKEINAKIEHHKNRGIFNKRELNARTYLQVFHNKAYEELQNRWEDQRLDKLEKELHAARRQLKEQKEPTTLPTWFFNTACSSSKPCLANGSAKT